MNIKTFFHESTYTLTYVVFNSNDAIVIDPVWDYEQASGRLSLEFIQEVDQFLKENKLNLHYILETHVHADHITGAQALKNMNPKAKTGVSEHITSVQEVFGPVFNYTSDFAMDGSQFDHLLKDQELIEAGSLKIKVLSTPGHTPACVSFLIEDAVFTGDALFMPDFGTGRCDFPKGDATKLYQSIKEKLYTLPDNTKVFVGHDYQPGGRELKFESSILEEKQSNIHIQSDTTEEEYVAFRTNRDKQLKAPVLLLPSLQINMNGGVLPEPEGNGVRYLKMPLKT